MDTFLQNSKHSVLLFRWKHTVFGADYIKLHQDLTIFKSNMGIQTDEVFMCSI